MAVYNYILGFIFGNVLWLFIVLLGLILAIKDKNSLWITILLANGIFGLFLPGWFSFILPIFYIIVRSIIRRSK